MTGLLGDLRFWVRGGKLLEACGFRRWDGNSAGLSALKSLYNSESTFESKEVFRGTRTTSPLSIKIGPNEGWGRGMTSKVSLGGLRAAALAAVLAGAVGSEGLMLHAGRRNNSRILLALFTLWVLSPFMALVLAEVVSKGWPRRVRVALHSAMLVVSLGCLGIYGDVALGPPRAKQASAFVVAPPACWLLIVIVVTIAAVISGRQSRRGEAIRR